MLELKNVSFQVEDKGKCLKIIDDISLTIPKDKFIVITGPNGGGKSTLAKIIMGIETPTSGKIFLDGEDITDKSITERAKLGIGYAFQQPPRFKGMTVNDLLKLAHGGELPSEVCCEFLTKVGLCSKDYLYREVDNSLSGGEVKRIEIATLLARELRIAIYDEPEAGIDLWSFKMLVETFKEMGKGHHESVIIISHQERIMNLADDIIVIAEGKIKTIGSKEEILPNLLGEVDTAACGLHKKEEAK